MRIRVAFFLLFFCRLTSDGFCVPPSAVEVDLNNQEITFADFCFGENSLNGNFLYSIDRTDNSLIFSTEGKDVTFNKKKFAWIKAKIAKHGNVLFIQELTLPNSTIRGTIDLKTSKVKLDVEASWFGSSEILEGLIYVNCQVWGPVNKHTTSGFLTVTDGIYEGQEFSRLRLDFFGKLPILNITDSEIVLYDGSIFEVDNPVLDLRNFSNPIIPNAEFVSQKLFFGEWQVFSESQTNAGLHKNIDERLDVFINTEENKNEDLAAGAEIRYNMLDDKYLKLRMQDDQTILGFERRKEF